MERNIKACRDFIKACEGNLVRYREMDPIDERAITATEGMIRDFEAQIVEWGGKV